MTRTDPLLSIAQDTAPGRRPRYSAEVICPIAVGCSDTTCLCRRPHRKLYTCNRCIHSLCPTCRPYTGKRGRKVKRKQDPEPAQSWTIDTWDADRAKAGKVKLLGSE